MSEKLSERLFDLLPILVHGHATDDGLRCLRDAATIVIAFEAAGPDVEDLTRRAREAHAHNMGLADDLFGYAAALVRAQQAEAKVAKAKALVEGWRAVDPQVRCSGIAMACAAELEAALGEPKEVRDGE